MESNKKIPIVMVYDNRRKELVEQTKHTLKENTNHPHELFFIEDKVGDHFNYIKLRNELIKNIPFDYDYLMYCDDDLYLTPGWLQKIKDIYINNDDLFILGGTGWPTNKKIETRDDVIVMVEKRVIPGASLFMSKKVWGKVGPYVSGKRKTHIICGNAIDAGGRIGYLRDEKIIVHCGLKSILSLKGRKKSTYDRMQNLVDSVGGISNL